MYSIRKPRRLKKKKKEEEGIKIREAGWRIDEIEEQARLKESKERRTIEGEEGEKGHAV